MTARSLKPLSSNQKQTYINMAPDSRPPFATYLLPSISYPFRRRQSSTASTSSTSNPPPLSFSPRSSISTSPSSSPPAAYSIPNPYVFATSAKSLLHEALQQEPSQILSTRQNTLYRAQSNTLKCVTCASDIAFADQIVSKGFTGRHGRAYLVGPPPSPSSHKNRDPSPPNGLLINTKIGRNVNRELLTGAHVVADVSCVICSAVLGWKYVDAKEMAQKYKIGKFILEMKRVVQGAGWEDGIGEGDEGLEEDATNEDREEEDEVIVFDEDDEDECEDLFAGVWNAEAVGKRRGRRVGNRK